MRIPRTCNPGIKLMQRLAFFRRTSLRLCPVFFNGTMILPKEEPGDVAGKVAIILAESHLLGYSL